MHHGAEDLLPSTRSLRLPRTPNESWMNGPSLTRHWRRRSFLNVRSVVANPHSTDGHMICPSSTVQAGIGTTNGIWKQARVHVPIQLPHSIREQATILPALHNM